MAKEKNNLDQFFKEKLENHTEKPSTLAWERLESQLPQKSKSNKGFWWAAAASLTILFTVGYLVLKEGEVSVEKPILADNKTEGLSEPSTQTETTPIEQSEKQLKGTEDQPETEELKTKPITTTPSVKPADTTSKSLLPQSTTPNNLVAMNEVKKDLKQETTEKTDLPKIEVLAPEIGELELPDLAMEKAVAEVVQPTDPEPGYTVKIYSNGLKEEPKDKNIIAEIGKTVNEVEGLLGKVDQGFADLQDAKNNLFASITTRKSKAGK
ncbi:hypothetical protein LZF95_21770 [Algoriphagus sp. AGSA1]|uniref:hypothetical protein n=1 Tax=Algoriphagus sp. AGSA1 TaxID=2907213 RepID=UPI001F422B5D|nr:hypothetical protein [Algoriphagus sp. AGSA1]MCE7057325.1 hypothetical protein [Algoriphagus sp. AGSA1]